MINAYPLAWPAGWPRSHARKRSKFGDYTFEYMRREVLRELGLLKASDIIISSNLRLRQDGFPYSGQAQPEDVGIAVYFKLNGEEQCIPCDKWHKTEDNLRAVVKTVEALRGIERWGAKEMVHAAFRGFKALPASVIVTPYLSRPWFEILGVSRESPPSVIRAAYRSLAKVKHPDAGGNASEFEELNRALKESGIDRSGDE